MDVSRDTGDPIIRVAVSLNFSGSPPWAGGVGRPEKAKKVGGGPSSQSTMAPTPS